MNHHNMINYSIINHSGSLSIPSSFNRITSTWFRNEFNKTLEEEHIMKTDSLKKFEETVCTIIDSSTHCGMTKPMQLASLFDELLTDLRSAVQGLQERQHEQDAILHAFEVSFLYRYHIVLPIIRCHYPKIRWSEIVNIVKQTSHNSLESAHRPPSPKIMAKRRELQSLCSIDLDKLVRLSNVRNEVMHIQIANINEQKIVMQVGGNSNAEAFCQQHGCETKDNQQKCSSRAAQLYREKLHQLATKAMKQYGTKIMKY
ncbi:unnamed protein product [Rotaria sp. Silwood1]|nr:unnamed protein product [Rotaria sp. Silwood1]